MSSIFFGIFISLLYSYHSIHCSEYTGSRVREILASIPSKDLDGLEQLFRSLFKESGFAYTLFGEKPMTCIDYNLGLTLRVLPDKNRIDAMAEGYCSVQLWRKYKHLFPTSRFEFIDYVSDDYSLFGFVLFNKIAIKNQFKKNNELLTSAFGDEEHLYQFFKQPPYSIVDKEIHPQFHHAFGILLGYGNSNSMTFAKRHETFHFLKKVPLNLHNLNTTDQNGIQLGKLDTEEFIPFGDFTNGQVSEGIETLNTLRDNYKFTVATNRGTALTPIDLPGFLSLLDDRETNQIKQAYDSIRSQIVEIYYSDNFLEKFLILLTS